MGHYETAEALLEEGVGVVNRIAHAGDRHTGEDLDLYRDRLGKKVMGIWAQAQVHATLALIEATSVSSAG